MKITILGSGNVATQLGLALKKAGHEIVQVYSRNADNARLLADALGCDATSETDDIDASAEMFIFAVKDDALSALAEKVGTKTKEAVFVHTAGSMPMSVFEKCATHYGVFYPMQTFSKERMVNFREIPVFVEASDDETLGMIKTLAAAVTDSVHELSSEKRKSLHLAAVFACNFTNHCYRLAERVLEDAGIDFSLYLPLIDETARKVHELSPRKAQTGPAIRYDENVIDRHIKMLTDDKTRELYRLMSMSIHEDAS